MGNMKVTRTMRKGALWILGGLISFTALAVDPDLLDVLATSASKAMYMTQDCNVPIDKEKFKNVAKLKAFTEGHSSLEGVSWDEVKQLAMQKLSALREAHPNGEHCQALEAQAENILPLLKQH